MLMTVSVTGQIISCQNKTWMDFEFDYYRMKANFSGCLSHVSSLSCFGMLFFVVDTELVQTFGFSTFQRVLPFIHALLMEQISRMEFFPVV